MVEIDTSYHRWSIESNVYYLLVTANVLINQGVSLLGIYVMIVLIYCTIISLLLIFKLISLRIERISHIHVSRPHIILLLISVSEDLLRIKLNPSIIISIRRGSFVLIVSHGVPMSISEFLSILIVSYNHLVLNGICI